MGRERKTQRKTKEATDVLAIAMATEEHMNKNTQGGGVGWGVMVFVVIAITWPLRFTSYAVDVKCSVCLQTVVKSM
jgi:hypothetical protein